MRPTCPGMKSVRHCAPLARNYRTVDSRRKWLRDITKDLLHGPAELAHYAGASAWDLVVLVDTSGARVRCCDSCADALISEATGWPRLPNPPPPETFRGRD